MERIDYQKKLEELRKENEQLKAQLQEKQVFMGKNGNIACRVKNRPPINLYKDQWETILSNAGRIKELLIAHDGKLELAPEASTEETSEPQADVA